MINRYNLLTIAALAGCLLLWSSTFVAIKIAFTSYSPESVIFLRFLIASIILIFFYNPKVNAKLTRKNAILIFLVGLALAAYVSGVSLALKNLSCSVASFIISTEPILIAIIASIFLKEELSLTSWMGTTVSLMGVILIFNAGEMIFWQYNSSYLIVFLATFASAIYCILQKPILAHHTSHIVVTYYTWIATILLLPLTPNVVADIPHSNIMTNSVLLYLAIFPTLVASLFWSFAVSRTPVSTASIIFYLLPFSTLLLGYVLLGETIRPQELIGGCITVIGAVIFGYHSIKQSFRLKVNPHP